MNENQKIWLATGGLLLGALAVIGGSMWRDRVDLGTGIVAANSRAQIADLRVDRRDRVPISETSYFTNLSELLKREYFEPIEDDQKLASGAIRGMVASLNDPDSQFMDAKEFAAWQNARRGEYEGIGIDLILEMPADAPKPESKPDDEPTPGAGETNENAPASIAMGRSDQRLPWLVVAGVAPGGPADRAGVQPGDKLLAIDQHVVVTPDLLARVRKFRDAVVRQTLKGEALAKEQEALREALERSLMPMRARDKVVLGTEGDLKVTWLRGTERRETQLTRAKSQRPAERDGALVVPLVAGVGPKLKEAIAGKSEVTLDLRENAFGDLAGLREALAALAPAGTYGQLVKRREGAEPRPLKIEQGNANPPKITLRVDKTTRGAAEALALALSSKGLARLSGEAMSGNRRLFDVVPLPDGGGFTLVTAEFRPVLPQKEARS